jgi:hypothetical protein
VRLSDESRNVNASGKLTSFNELVIDKDHMFVAGFLLNAGHSSSSITTPQALSPLAKDNIRIFGGGWGSVLYTATQAQAFFELDRVETGEEANLSAVREGENERKGKRNR